MVVQYVRFETMEVSANVKSQASLASEPPSKIFADNVIGLLSDAALIFALPKLPLFRRLTLLQLFFERKTQVCVEANPLYDYWESSCIEKHEPSTQTSPTVQNLELVSRARIIP